MSSMRNPKRMKFDSGVDTGQSGGGRVQLNFVREILQSKDVLNVGCWTGDFENRAGELVGSMISIDIEPEALEVARKSVPTAEFLEASVLEMPFTDESFDVVTMWDVIEHIPVNAEARALAEIARVLCQGGYLALSTPNSHLLSRIFDPAYFLAGHRHYSFEQLSRMLEEAGFTVERVKVFGGWCSILSILVFYIWKYLFHRKPGMGWLARACEKNEEKTGFNVLFVLARRI